MATSTITQLPSGATLSGAELIEIVQESESYKVSMNTVKNFGGGGGGAGWTYSPISSASGLDTWDIYTSIPAGVQEIELMLNNVLVTNSYSGHIQVGNSGGYLTTGYRFGYMYGNALGIASFSLSQNGVDFPFSLVTDENGVSGVVKFMRWDTTKHKWFMDYILLEDGASANNYMWHGNGFINTISDITRMRLIVYGGKAPGPWDGGSARLRYR